MPSPKKHTKNYWYLNTSQKDTQDMKYIKGARNKAKTLGRHTQQAF